MTEEMSGSFSESGEQRGAPTGLRLIAVLVALTAAYFVAGKLGLALAFVHANATAVWPPTGIALAAGLLFGLRVWPAILVGAFLVNLTTPGTTVATSLGIAAGNTLEAVVGTWLVQTFAGGASAFRRPHGVFRFAVLAAVLATTVSASIGVVSLWLGGLAETASIADIWLTWWLGDAVGALLVAPLLVVWARPAGPGNPSGGWLEAAALVAVLAGIGWVVFGQPTPNAYLCLLPIIWAAFRFGRRGATSATAALSGIALLGTLNGYGPFVREAPNESLLFLQAFVGTMALTALALAAEVRERERIEGAVRKARDELETQVSERTSSLQEAVDQLMESRSALSEAQAVAHIGSWEWDVVEDRVSWSDELFRIYGLEPQSETIDYEGFLSRAHSQDRERVETIVRASFESGQPFQFEHRIVRPNGEVRSIYAHGQVIRDGDRTVRMLGTGQDITERRTAEQALRETEQRFRILAERSSDIISFSDPGGPPSYLSPAIRRVLGYTPEELVGQERFDLVHPEDLPGLQEIQKGLGESLDSSIATFRVRHRAGHYVWLESVATIVRSQSGEAEGMVTVSRDVTERVERARFRELVQGVTTVANAARSTHDALGGALAVICRFKDWPLGHVYMIADEGGDELVPTTIWHSERSADHEEFRRVTEATRFRRGIGLPGRVLASGQPAWIPNVVEDPNFPRARLVKDLGLAAAFGFPVRAGEQVLAVLEFFTTEVLGPDERFLEVLHEIGDLLGQVLQRLQVENTLRGSEAMLEQAQAIAHVGSWDWDVGKDRVSWTDELFRIYGREPGSIALHYEEFLAHVHPDDRSRIDRTVKAALAGSESFNYEYRLVRPDGTVRTVRTQGHVIREASGRAERMYGVCQDVTDQKAAELALRHSEQRYRFLADYATDLITTLTPDGVCTYASPAARSMLGYAPEELVGRPAVELVHREDLEAVASARRSILKSFASQSVTCRVRMKSGGWLWVETTSRGVREPSTGMVESIVAVTRNVTERMRAVERTQLLQQVTAIANAATTVETAMRQALEAISRFTGWPIGHVYIPSRDADGRLTPSDIWYLQEPEGLGDLRVLREKTPVAVGEGLPGLVLATGRAQWVADIALDPSFIRRSAAESLGLRSALAFPVNALDETLAVLEFFSTEPQSIEVEHLSLMENVGAQLGLVVRRQRAEAALRTSEVRFRAVAETANDAVITIDDESRIVYCNPATTRMFGYEDLVGRPLETIIPERLRAQHRAGLQRYVATGESRILGETVELVGLHRDGHEFPVELSISDWRTDEGLFFTGLVRDITGRREAEQALTEKVEELARSNAELALFSYVASHDLREPLRTVASNVQLIERGLDDRMTPAARKSVRFALDGVHRMQALIEDLLAYSRVGTEGKSFQSVAVDDVLDEVLAALEATIEAAGAEVSREPLPTITADRTQLAQVFQNLLSNALKFHDERPPRIHVSATQEGDAWEFSVRDEGIGFDPQFAEHIFTIFQRLHPPEDFPGTGIGLAICRKIVERHGGRIWVETSPGEGSVFRFTIPIRE
jgi:PAS domain S-box-containing protein